MEFSDNETQKLLRETARDYLAATYPWERLYALEQQAPSALPEADLAAFARMGWFGLLAPEPAGGGLRLVEAAAVIEELGYAAVAAPVLVTNVAAALLGAAGKEFERELAGLASGEARVTVSSATRRQAPALSAFAPVALSGGRLRGTLPAVPFAEDAVAVIAPVQLDGDDALALLPLRDATLQQARQLDRPYFSHVTFDDAPVDGVRLLAQGERARSMHDHCDTLLTGLGLIELSGAMQRVLRMTADYISTRVQFGQPVAKFQSARHHAADMFMQVDATRWAAYHALDQYERLGDASGIWLSKLWAERAAAMVYELAHLLHGGVGVGIEYPLHLFTQGLAALAVRDGAAGEMTNRALATLGLAAGTRA